MSAASERAKPREVSSRNLRVGIIGVGVMGSNHARVLCGASGRRTRRHRRSRPQPGDENRRVAWAAMRSPTTNTLIGARHRCRDRRGPHAFASFDRARLHRGRRQSPGRKTDRADGGRGPRDRRRRAPQGRQVDGRPCRALQPDRAGDQAGDRDEDILSIAITRVGPFPPRMSNVGVVIDLAVHDIDLIRWFTESEIIEVQPQLTNAMRSARTSRFLQFRTASGVLAHINTNWLTPFKARTVHVATRTNTDRRSLDAAGDRVLRLPARRQLFDAAFSVGHAEPLRAELLPSSSRSATTKSRWSGRRRCRESRDRNPVPGRRLLIGAASPAPRKVVGYYLLQSQDPQ